MDFDPNNTITIYTDAACAGSVAAVGTAADLEGIGIPVTVPPDSVTTFYATQSDLAETSGCSGGLEYQQVTTPPAPPSFTAVTPPSPANDNSPRPSGSAAANSVVSIYTNSSCSGAAVASGTAAAFAGAGIQVSVPDNSVTDFYAVATLAGISSTCSTSTISFQEVTPPDDPGGGGGEPPGEPPAPNPPGKPPAPKLTTLPGGTANFNTPLVTGRASGAATVKIFGAASCRGPVLVKGSAAEFAAGLPVQVADDVTMTFYGVTVDGGGDQSVCSSDPAVYVEDSTAPRALITAAPGVKTRKRTATFRFTDATGDEGTSFTCKLDRRRWRLCHAPLRLRKLGRRGHILRVKAVDGAGNRDNRGTKRRFKVIAR
jgi:ribonuclease HI